MFSVAVEIKDAGSEQKLTLSEILFYIILLITIYTNFYSRYYSIGHLKIFYFFLKIYQFFNFFYLIISQASKPGHSIKCLKYSAKVCVYIQSFFP